MHYTRWIGVTAVGLAVLGEAAPAHADPPASSTGLPRITQASIGLGDARGSAGVLDAATVEPLRLTLLGEHALTPTSQCGDAFVDARAGRSALLQTRAFGGNLLGGTSWRSPRLSLFGFSRAGCAFDGSVGSGIALTLPLTKTVSIMVSGGAIYLPNPLPGTTNRTVSGAGRIDVVFRRDGGRSFNVGIGNRGMSFGGVW